VLALAAHVFGSVLKAILIVRPETVTQIHEHVNGFAVVAAASPPLLSSRSS